MNDRSASDYVAFISYSHVDERTGRWLHRALESYRVPKRLVGTEHSAGVIPKRLTPVFRDRDELPTATDLGETIRGALERSAALIVVCSPAAARSRWVNEEILTFRRLGRDDRIFGFIVGGEPNASGNPATIEQECFPQALRFRPGLDGQSGTGPAEPIAADARPGKDGRHNAKLKLVAGLLGVGFDELKQREQQRRQKRMLAVTVAAVAGMAIMSGLTLAAWFARQEAQQERARAEIEAATAQQTNDFLISLFEVSDPSEARGNTITAREVLDRGSAQIADRLADQPAVRANLLATMGRVYTGLGLYEPAKEQLEEALQLRNELFGQRSEESVRTEIALGSALYLKGEYEGAETAYRRAVDAARAAHDGPHADLSAALNGLAEVLAQGPELDAAERLFREALDMNLALYGAQDAHVAASQAGLAVVLLYDGKLEDAERLFREALKIRRDTLGQDHPLVAETLNNLAYLLYFAQKHDQAEAIFREVLKIDRHIYGNEHPEVSSLMNNLGRMLLEDDQLSDAAPLLEEALRIDRKLRDPMHDDLAFSLNSLALIRADQGRFKEAEPLFAEALEIVRKHGHRLEGPVLTNLADLYCRMQDFDRAAVLIEEARPVLTRDYEDEPWRFARLDSVEGARLAGIGRFERAETMLVDSYPVIAERWGTDSFFARLALERIDDLYRQWQKPERARQFREQMTQLKHSGQDP